MGPQAEEGEPNDILRAIDLDVNEHRENNRLLPPRSPAQGETRAVRSTPQLGSHQRQSPLQDQDGHRGKADPDPEAEGKRDRSRAIEKELGEEEFGAPPIPSWIDPTMVIGPTWKTRIAAAFTIVPRIAGLPHRTSHRKKQGQECLGIPGPVDLKPLARSSSGPALCPDGSS